MTHKPHILNIVDNILLMKDGQIVLCGSRGEVLEKMAKMQKQHQEEAAKKAQMQRDALAKRQAAEPPAKREEPAQAPKIATEEGEANA